MEEHMTYLIASIVGELVVFISALYYACTLHGIGWCPRFLLVCFALSTVFSLASSLLNLAFEVQKRKFVKALVEMKAFLDATAARDTPPSERN